MEQPDSQKKNAEMNRMHQMLAEHLKCFVCLGYDYQGERTILYSCSEPIEDDAVSQILHDFSKMWSDPTCRGLVPGEETDLPDDE